MESLSVKELRVRCKEEGMLVSGSKQELIDRLKEIDEVEEVEEEEQDESGFVVSSLPIIVQEIDEDEEEEPVKKRHHHHKHGKHPISSYLANIGLGIEVLAILAMGGLYDLSLKNFDVWVFLANLFRPDFLLGPFLIYYIWYVIIPMIFAVFLNIEKAPRYSVFSFSLARIMIYYALSGTGVLKSLFDVVPVQLFAISTITSLVVVVWEQINFKN